MISCQRYHTREKMDEQNEKLVAGIWLSKMARFSGLGNKTICQLLEYSKGIIPLYNLNAKTILELISGPPEKIMKTSMFLKDDKNRKSAKEDGITYNSKGIRLLTWMDPLYPDKLKTIASAPGILYIGGENHEKILKQKYSVAIVGTRTPSPYGEAVTKKIVKEISDRDVVVISGMARGIDSLAHQTVLENGGMTIAVLGCGLDIVYPPENKYLMDRIIKNGLILSECPPGTKPLKSYFPARNRIISGLADCVAVMEASRKSGTMITAGYAGEQGRDLFAVPGSIFSPNSSGTNQLIQDGACVLTHVDDMLWKLPFQTIQNLMEPDLTGAKCLFTNQNLKEVTISDILKHTEKTTDEIASKLGITVDKTTELLSFMELSGKVILRNGRFSLTESYK